ncbi:hypothetical protein AN958_05150 [Leucoagaricus sp. SymC.cos]|nr:hypothetical protein AN958_05150 [Leucoagaricus sp. SymC.cos]
MWSYNPFIHKPVLKLFQRNINLDGFSFQPYRVEHLKSKNKIILVSAPPIRGNATAIQDSIEVIKSQLDSKGVKLINHIYVHDISRSDHLYKDGTPEDCRELEDIFEGTVKMDQVSLLLTGWEEVRLEKGVEWELKIRRALAKNVESGLLFEHLRFQDEVLAWSVLDEMADLSCVRLDGKKHIEVRVKKRDITGEEIRVEVLQKEIDGLCVKLNRSAEGRKLCEEIQKYFADRQAWMESLFAQMDDNHEIPRKKKEAEATLEHGYLIFRKTMWAFFEEIERLRIEIGPMLENFYGYKYGPALEEPKRKKGYLEQFFGLYL